MRKMMTVGVIYGSTRPGRFCDRVARWVIEEIEADGAFLVEAIDPLDAALADPDSVRSAIARSDAFVIVTPEYNHSYPAPLKALIDGASSEWHAKPVAFVSYGGGSGGTRAVEHLRGVFAELHAVGLRDSLSFANAWERFDAAGRLIEPERARRTMAVVLARLRWWAGALLVARSTMPYAEAA
ncbi:NADPH-dependent FMN reductase [Allosphingosinicella deserti]|uniref:FMN reductase n=1 Tax=Allosphingosinicella deserti TaxID=2116704 RepID=A0A2P7QYC2_9SPHN|nr:NAD(P)H-dependent oxidoreductase [Sphingomonas deserti]PSJ42964.1 FMN reductase [Sphingomonas deserti]